MSLKITFMVIMGVILVFMLIIPIVFSCLVNR